METRWQITDKGDRDVRLLADRHYTRPPPGARGFCRNGQNLVFVTGCGKAGWVTFRPTPGKATRPDGLAAWECALFRNESVYRSSDLIREATALTFALWGFPPPDGLITFVKPERVRTTLELDGVVGYCYRRAARRRVGYSGSNALPLFRAPRPVVIEDWSRWGFRGGRGGKLRGILESSPSVGYDLVF